MPTAILTPPTAASIHKPAPTNGAGLVPLPPLDDMPRKRWTRTAYHALIQSGLVEEGSPYELIEGEIVEKMPQDRKHVLGAMRSQRTMNRVFGEEYVQSQSPIAADETNEPEPDIAVLRQTIEAYADNHPIGSDILLLIEVTNTTQNRDRVVKALVYARSGVPEYWILDLNARTLTVLRDPSAEGYQTTLTLTETESVTPLSAPAGVTVAVTDLLPPA